VALLPGDLHAARAAGWNESLVWSVTGRAFCRRVSFLPAETQPAKPALVIRYSESPEQRLAPCSTCSLCSGGTADGIGIALPLPRPDLCPYVRMSASFSTLSTVATPVRRSVWGKPGPWTQNGWCSRRPRCSHHAFPMGIDPLQRSISTIRVCQQHGSSLL
jgi:hypothetical protein